MLSFVLRSNLAAALLCVGMSCSAPSHKPVGKQSAPKRGQPNPKSPEDSISRDAVPSVGIIEQEAPSTPQPPKKKTKGTPNQPAPAKRGEFYVYTRGEGGWESGKLWYSVTKFRPEGYAVAEEYSRTVLIDRQEKTIGSVYIFDNHPDSVQDGVMRMREGGKVRYFSLKDGAYFKGSWDYGTPFDRGVACVCNDCLVPDGDYNRVEGGVSWFINDKGKILRSYTNPIVQCDLHHREGTKEWVFFVDRG